jgi:periplasmic copper chaperone A
MRTLISASLLTLAFVALPAAAQVQVDEPWVRATVPQQQATGAFMQLTATVDSRLVEVHSPAADIVEIHEMRMDGDIMRMRAVEALPLPAGQAVELKPGGYHIMLIDLKEQAREGDTVAVTLIIEDKDGKRETIEIDAPVRPLGTAGSGHKHGHGHRH